MSNDWLHTRPAEVFHTAARGRDLTPIPPEPNLAYEAATERRAGFFFPRA
jgi:hypothetical protein